MERRRVRALLARAGGVRVAFADMVRWVVASLCLVAALFWCWMFGADSASPEVQPATAVDNASPNAARAEVGSRDQADDASSGARTEVGTKPEPDFVSVDENGELIADAARDGIVVEVREADGKPCANCAIDVNWRKGFGLYGHDRGRTEADGTFATTVRQPSFFEALTLKHPVHGEMSNGATPMASAADPHRVVYTLPRLTKMRAVVRALDGSAVAGAKVEWQCFPERRNVRDAMLIADAPTGETDSKGELVVSVPVGAADVSAAIGDDKPAQVVTMRVPPGGGTIDLVVLKPEARVEASIELVLPFAADSHLHLNTWGNSPLPMPKSPLVIAVDPKQRDYEAQQIDALHYTVRVDALPWNASVRRGSDYYPRMEVAAGQRNVRIVCDKPMVLEEPRKALVHVTVLGPGGEPYPGASLRVHETPDLVYGSDQTQTSGDGGKLTLRLHATGKKVCVSARDYKLPWSVSEPIALVEGEQNVELRLQAGGTVRGIVLDERGERLPSNVMLHRPAGGLRGLDPSVGEILDSTASGDSIGTSDAAEFWFHGVGPGEHEVWAYPTRGGMLARARVRAGDEVTLRQGQGSEGFVLMSVVSVDATTGKPVEVTDVDVFGSVGVAERQEREGAPFTCVVQPGKFTVCVRAIDYVLYEQEVTVGNAPTTHEARLERSPLRFVVLRDESGAPLWPAEVRVQLEEGVNLDSIDEHGNYAGEVLRTDRNGHVTMRGLSGGAYTLVVERGNPSNYETDGKPRRLALPAGAGIDSAFEIVVRE